MKRKGRGDALKRQHKTYSSLKDSHVEWLGEIPNSWRLKRLKFVSEISTGEKDTVDNVDDGLYPFFVRSQTIEKINSWSFDGEAVLTAGDGVGVAKVFHYINGKFDFHQRVYKFSNFRHISGKFFFYYIRELFKEEVIKLSAKSTVDSLRLPMIANFAFCIPDRKEQKTIVDFLDKKTALIDSLVQKKEKQIELLKEKRAALITQAVTKGLDPKAKMKDSGIEWLGEIPEHWKIERIINLGILLKGQGGSKADVSDIGIPCVRYGDIYTKHNFYVDSSDGYVSTEKSNNYTSILFGDVLFAASGETIDEIGKSVVNLMKTESCCGGDILIWRPRKQIDALFSGYFLDCLLSHFQKSRIGKKVTVAHIYRDQLKNILFVLPPFQEQESIADFLDKETSRIDSLMEKIKQSIGLLKEYRSALITAAVTGKIDVREESQMKNNPKVKK